MEHQEFLAAYRDIIRLACARLADNRFACFVIGDVRDRQGFYRNLPGATVAAFEAAGLRLYNRPLACRSGWPVLDAARGGRRRNP
jgi:hypothetical protein